MDSPRGSRIYKGGLSATFNNIFGDNPYGNEDFDLKFRNSKPVNPRDLELLSSHSDLYSSKIGAGKLPVEKDLFKLTENSNASFEYRIERYSEKILLEVSDLRETLTQGLKDLHNKIDSLRLGNKWDTSERRSSFMDFTSSLMSGPVFSDSTVESCHTSTMTDKTRSLQNLTKRSKRRKCGRIKRIIVRVPCAHKKLNVSPNVSPKVSEPRTITILSNDEDDAYKFYDENMTDFLQKSKDNEDEKLCEDICEKNSESLRNVKKRILDKMIVEIKETVINDFLAKCEEQIHNEIDALCEKLDLEEPSKKAEEISEL